MAYLVIAVGLLMSLAGGYLLNYGYAIVQVERGWSSVIAGSVFLTGGLVTMGLGLLLRAVLDVKRNLIIRPVLAGGTMTADIADLPSISTTTGAIATPSLPRTTEPPVGSREADLSATAGTPPRDPVPTASEPHVVDREEPRVELPMADHDRHRTGIAAEPRHGDEANLGMSEAHPRQTTSSTRDAAAGAPAMDDWLDRAFSELDDVRSPRAERHGIIARDAAAQGASPPQQDERTRAVEPVHADSSRADIVRTEPADVEPAVYAERVPSLQPPSPAATSPQASPVIGRYESDDTFYVMYADGSIEAQSPAGIYRFSSMAELKAFIEG